MCDCLAFESCHVQRRVPAARHAAVAGRGRVGVGVLDTHILSQWACCANRQLQRNRVPCGGVYSKSKAKVSRLTWTSMLCTTVVCPARAACTMASTCEHQR